MKKVTTFAGRFGILIALLFLIFPVNYYGCGCNCGSFLVKFEWNGSEFVPEGGDSKGIIITEIVSKPNEPNEPMVVSWESTSLTICSVEIKHGRFYYTQTFDSNVKSGTSSSQSWNAISNLVFCSDGSMPVELSSFNVNLESNTVALIWETATEVNNYGFEIQRSPDNNTWQKVGFVEGHGNSNSPKHYSYTDQSVSKSGKYFYRLKQIDIDGQYEYSDMVSVELTAPDGFQLNQNYPNPFNPATTISYSLPVKSDVELVVYNLFGQEIKRLVDATQESGNYAISFDGSNLASGVYIYTIKTNQYSSTKRLVLLK